jgi:hypothetical protein
MANSTRNSKRRPDFVIRGEVRPQADAPTTDIENILKLVKELEEEAEKLSHVFD